MLLRLIPSINNIAYLYEKYETSALRSQEIFNNKNHTALGWKIIVNLIYGMLFYGLLTTIFLYGSILAFSGIFQVVYGNVYILTFILIVYGEKVLFLWNIATICLIIAYFILVCISAFFLMEFILFYISIIIMPISLYSIDKKTGYLAWRKQFKHILKHIHTL